MRVLFVNRYFHPDHSATSQIASDLAFHLASRGHQVTVVTSRQRYDDASAQLPRSDETSGVRIVRVWSTRFGRAGLAGRAVDYATFYVSAFFAVLRRRNAVVVAMTDPPLISVIAALASRRLVNWVQDLFPEVAEVLGIRAPSVLRKLRDWSLRRARANVVLGDLMASRVPKAVVIHNWADAGLHPAEGGNEQFVVGYSGNLGRAHEFTTILAAMQELPDVRFLFTGGGAQLETVKRAAGKNAEFRPYAPRERLSESLSAADVHLVSLQPGLEGLIVPSKFYGVLAVARPVIFIGARDGELARIIEASECGAVVEPGDVAGLVRTIRSMADDRARTARMGSRGRELYLSSFSPERAFAKWERVLEECSS